MVREELRDLSCYVPSVDAEEEIDGAPPRGLLESLVQTFVAGIRGTPDLILERLVHVVFGVRLDDEETCLQQTVSISRSKIT